MTTIHCYSKSGTQDHLLPIADSAPLFHGKKLMKTHSLIEKYSQSDYVQDPVESHA